MKVTVFGIGYVGLTQGAVLAEVGHDVVCVGIDADKVNRLKLGQIPIYEPGLSNLVKENCTAGRLTFTTDAAAGVKHGEVQFIAVGTPPDEDGSADLQYVLAVAQVIAQHMESPQVVINKSTVPVGTADRVTARMTEILARRGRSDLTFDVVSNPEFLKEGSAVGDCMKPDRIITGTSSKVHSAELTKYAVNCMLATKISFMNEMVKVQDRCFVRNAPSSQQQPRKLSHRHDIVRCLFYRWIAQRDPLFRVL